MLRRSFVTGNNHTACGPRQKAKGAGDKSERDGCESPSLSLEDEGRRVRTSESFFEFSPKSLADEAQLAVGRAYGEDAPLVDERRRLRSLEQIGRASCRERV